MEKHKQNIELTCEANIFCELVVKMDMMPK